MNSDKEPDYSRISGRGDGVGTAVGGRWSPAALPPSEPTLGKHLEATGMSRIRLLGGLLAVLLIAGPAPAYVAARAHADEVTVSQDDLRTGWDPSESTLSSGSVAGSDFGQLFATQLDGQIYAQPLVVGNTLIVATDNDYVYGVDKVTGAIEWTDDLGPSWPASTVGCGDLTPNVGVTSTPVYDPSTGYVYLVAMINDGTDDAHPHWKMFAVSPSTGAQRTGWPVTIQSYPDNDATRAFNSMTAMQRPGLLLTNGAVYAAFGSHCDYQPYVGYVVGVSTSAQSTHMWADEVGSTSTEGGFWQSGGGIVSDGSGRMVLASGNGVAGVEQLTVSPTSLSFGSVSLGKTAYQSFTITNSGNLPLTIDKAAPPAAPFSVANPISEGQQIAPGDSMTVTVGFTPVATGAVSGVYQITADTGAGPQPVAITATGVQPTSGIAVPTAGGGWTLNGSAAMSGSQVVLTGAADSEGGSAVYGTPVATSGLTANFTASLGGGTGADGLTFALLNPADESSTSLGYKGGGMGALGMVGTYVVFDTYPKQMAMIETVAAKAQSALTEVQTAKGIPDLRAGTHQVQVSISGSILTVDLDGNLVLQAGDGLPSNGGMLVGFTASTGGLTDAHSATGVSITASKYEN